MALPATPPTPRSFDKETYCDALLLSAGQVTQTPGSAILITASVTATAVALTLQSGNPITVNPPVGDTIYPLQVTKYAVSSGTVTAAYNLFK
jgi:hypothetical protein